MIAEDLGISRQGLHRHLRKLIAEKFVICSGKTRGATYALRSPEGLRQIVHKTFRSPFPSEDIVQRQEIGPLIQELPENLKDIIHYTFTELFNNAIEHARAKKIEVKVFEDRNTFGFEIQDNGIGCFEHIRIEKKLVDHFQAIEELSKGRLTTSKAKHSGEGIFFASKTATKFVLESDRLAWNVDNERSDVAVGPSVVIHGTRVEALVSKAATHKLQDIFSQYTDDEYRFSKTRIYVRLFERGEVFMSRSEAKRLLAGLDRYEEIILDFSGVRTIGQGFADEIFRVFSTAHPNIRMSVVKATDNVAFMIRRAELARAETLGS